MLSAPLPGRAPCSLHGARCGPAGHRAYDWLVANPQLVQSRQHKLTHDSTSRRRHIAGVVGQAKSHPLCSVERDARKQFQMTFKQLGIKR